jgi:hypothetical protein
MLHLVIVVTTIIPQFVNKHAKRYMVVSIIIATIISVLWVRGIDHMKNNHPDYDGKDLFNE